MPGLGVETLSDFANEHKGSLGNNGNALKLVCGIGCINDILW